MSGYKEWPELVGKTFKQASRAILAFDRNLHPYNARNGIENYMYDPVRVSCVTNDYDIVVKTPHYTYPVRSIGSFTNNQYKTSYLF